MVTGKEVHTQKIDFFTAFLKKSRTGCVKMGLAHEKKSYLQEKANLFEIGSTDLLYFLQTARGNLLANFPFLPSISQCFGQTHPKIQHPSFHHYTRDHRNGFPPLGICDPKCDPKCDPRLCRSGKKDAFSRECLRGKIKMASPRGFEPRLPG